MAALAVDRVEAAQRPITHDVYDGWRSIQDTKLSDDGVWVVYTLAPQDGDSHVVTRNLKTGVEYRHPRGKEPLITVDTRFVLFTIAPAKADVDKARMETTKKEEQPKNGLGILDLASGRVATFDGIKSFKLPGESGRFAAYLKEPRRAETARAGQPVPRTPERNEDPGGDLVIRELATGAATVISEVIDYAWSGDGHWIAHAVSSRAQHRNGVFLRHAVDGSVRTLLAGAGRYKGLAFDERGAQLAFISDRDDVHADAPAFKLYHWMAPARAATELVSATTPGMPPGLTVSEHGTPKFSNDGARLYLDTAPRRKAQPEHGSDAIKVDIWHWKDPLLQPMQKARAEEETKRGYPAIVHIRDRRFVQLASSDMPAVALVDGGAAYALGSSEVPYRHLLSWDGRYEDLYLVDLEDGSRRKIVQQAKFGIVYDLPTEGQIGALSPAGTYVLWFDTSKTDWFALRVSDGRSVNLTENLGVKFERETWDTFDFPRPYGTAGWTADDRSVLLYDRYDIWEVQPDDGSARMITNGLGRRESLVFRYQKLDHDEQAIPVDRPLLLSTVHDRTKASGFYRAAIGGVSDPIRAVMLDKAFGDPIKAKNADTVIVTLSRFEEFPNLWVTDTSFSSLRQVSDANPQQAELTWGRAELIDFSNADGQPLRAVLIKPDDFDPQKTYPLMVHIYTELTGSLHRYIPPAPGTSINITRYVSNGYVVLMPDIVYRLGFPGESAVKCVVPAVQRVLSMGFIDPARIGIQGHSWGGYQISYMITRTNIFRAAEAGASVVNTVSAYGGIRWGQGMSRAFQYEKGTGRMGGPPWERAQRYIENSPIFWVDTVTTPYLTIHNDEDDAVPWYQGIEFFSALRRLGREAYLFNYNGERHGLRDRERQKHWTVHMAEFFDHHLKSAPRPEWMERGVPYLERGARHAPSY
ncbi:MAG: prolyl oligopeptidase family serine peptidase [Vicinamibacterales bacterium]